MADRPLKHDVFLLALTAGFGAGLTYLFQENADRHAREAELRESRRTAATQVVQDVGHMIDRRLVGVSSYLYALGNEDSPAEVTRRKQANLEMFDEWTRSALTNTALICRYYGADVARTFLDSIWKGFTNLHGHVNTLASARSKQEAKERFGPLEDEFEALRQKAFRFNLTLVDRVRAGTVVEDQKQSACLNIPIRTAPVSGE
jgi:hypothetical protein